MPRPSIIAKPVRLHLLLEKETVVKLRKLAARQAKTLTQILRDLADSYASGRVVVRQGSLDEVVSRIRKIRDQFRPTAQRSENVIRALRDMRA
jgi:hypothetical protein